MLTHSQKRSSFASMNRALSLLSSEMRFLLKLRIMAAIENILSIGALDESVVLNRLNISSNTSNPRNSQTYGSLNGWTIYRYTSSVIESSV